MNDEQLNAIVEKFGADEWINRRTGANADARSFASTLLADGGKGEAVQNVMNIPLDAAATMTDYAQQAECAPREAQPVTEILRLLNKMHDECGTNAGQDALWDAHEAIKQLFAAPTPEREAQPVFRCNDCGGFDIEQVTETMAPASSAAPTPERAQESAGVHAQDPVCGGSHVWCNRIRYCLGSPSCAEILAADKEPQP
jgi:hypothetical protein